MKNRQKSSLISNQIVSPIGYQKKVYLDKLLLIQYFDVYKIKDAMIVYEQPNAFVMVRQHDHAHLSGWTADHWDLSHFKGSERLHDVLYAVYQHDRSWISLDEMPLWNDKDHMPYSFSDFPLIPKLRFYTMGLDETEKENPYAALLCSMHYASFFEGTIQPDSHKFLLNERNRQEKLREQCSIQCDEQKEVLQYHFHLLQFCDDVSLYVCLNEPGVSKAEEHPWYRKGFRNSEVFSNEKQQQIIAHWVDAQHIIFSPFPFREPFHAQVQTKVVLKELVKSVGIAQAYDDTHWSEREVIFIASEGNRYA